MIRPIHPIGSSEVSGGKRNLYASDPRSHTNGFLMVPHQRLSEWIRKNSYCQAKKSRHGFGLDSAMAMLG